MGAIWVESKLQSLRVVELIRSTLLFCRLLSSSRCTAAQINLAATIDKNSPAPISLVYFNALNLRHKDYIEHPSQRWSRISNIDELWSSLGSLWITVKKYLLQFLFSLCLDPFFFPLSAPLLSASFQRVYFRISPRSDFQRSVEHLIP